MSDDAGPAASEGSRGGAPRGLTTSRLEAFSDGIIAIVATLLGFELRIPEGIEHGLATALIDAWPAYATYVVTFLTLAVVWINHHHAFSALRRIDMTVLWCNTAILLCLGAVPFINSLLARYLDTAEAGPAAATYGIVFAAATLPWIPLWRHVHHHPELLADGVPRELPMTNVGRSAIGAGLYGAAAVVALWLPWVAAIAYALLALMFALTAKGD